MAVVRKFPLSLDLLILTNKTGTSEVKNFGMETGCEYASTYTLRKRISCTSCILKKHANDLEGSL
jgi:hypothetical protein